jgi:hypothetical protein
MTEHQGEHPHQPEAERYYAEYVGMSPGPEGSAVAALQVAINEKARQSWKLVSVTQDPTSEGVILIWDTTGFFSG